MRSLACMLLFATLAAAQQASPYSGQEQRAIKSLSEQEIVDLREGNGMGFAKAAELNGYPGPKHVLELADKLELSAGQKRQVEAEFARMKAAAKELGEQVIAAELRLEELFRGGGASEDEVGRASAQVAELRGRLRATHLAAHISTTQILSTHQRHLYQQLRGYGSGHQQHH